MTGGVQRCSVFGMPTIRPVRAWLPQTAVFILRGPNGERRDVSSWKNRASSGTLCIVACLARMIAVDTPHRVRHTPPRSAGSVQPYPPETSRPHFPLDSSILKGYATRASRLKGMKWNPLVLLLACSFPCVAQTPSVTNVTNSALPALDLPPNSVHLAPRSMATVWGANLAANTISTSPPWQRNLGGTEVHLAGDSCYDTSCDLVADLIYVSPTQINFVVPGVNPSILWNTRIVLLRDGVRFDDRSRILGGPGRVIIDALYLGDYYVVFGVGYECVFSFSLTDPSACGVSWFPGEHRAMLGAVTDVSGQLITSQNPVRQGQIVTFWMTGFTGLSLDTKTGLLQQAHPGPLYFGVAQYGKDIPSTIGSGVEGEFGRFRSQAALWAGESPQFVGLDQINVNFPVCTSQRRATTEKRYDVFLTYTSVETSTTVRVYLPFLLSPGDAECGWVGTTTSVTSSVNPSVSGQSVTFTATVLPSSATGTVTFLDGSVTLGTGTLAGGTATFATSGLLVGNHSIMATYNGDSDYGESSATRTQTVKASTATTLTSSVNPSVPGQPVTFTATVSPSAATGVVTFFDGDRTLGSGTLSGGKATFSSSSLGAGSHSIKATYNGDSNYGSSSGALTQKVMLNTSTTLTSSTNPTTFGQPVTFTATISPCCTATGTVTFFDGNSTLGSGPLVYLSQSGIVRATFFTSNLSVGTHSITASYGGDGHSNGSTSAVLTQTIWTISLTSSPNPSLWGQMVTLTACGIPHGTTGTVAFLDGTTTLGTNTVLSVPCTSFGTNILSVGTHSITARYSDNYGGTSSAVVTHTVNAH